MPTYTSNAKFGSPVVGDEGYTSVIAADQARLDGMTAVGGLCVTPHETPSSTSLLVDVAAGSYVKQDGTVGTFAGAASQAIAASSTKVLYLDLAASGTLMIAASYPTTPHVRIATVVAGTTTITSIADNRQCFDVVGSWADGVNITLGSTTGTQIGTAATQKLGFYGKTPTTQPSGGAQAALTDSTGGTVGATLAAVGATNSADQSAAINGNFASLNNLVEALRAALVAEGLIKGSA